MAVASPTEVLSLLRDGLPLCEAMQVEVMEAGASHLRLAAPFELNCNPLNTAFAGSLYSICVLAGWALLQIKLRERGLKAQTVVAHSQSWFRRPVRRRIEAACHLPQKEVFWKFLAAYQKTGKGRIQLTSRVVEGENLAYQLDALFAVRKIDSI